ncbi:MAG: hypothetical protein ACK504_04140 [Bacteroidota bacterium]
MKQNYLSIFSWGLLLFSIITSYSQFTENSFQFFFHSDSLGIPNFYKDIVNDNGQLKDWYWAPSPSFFPDVAIYFLMATLFKLSVLKTLFISGIVQVLILANLLIYFFTKLVDDDLKKHKCFIPFFISLYFFESLYFSKDLQFSFYLMTLGFHIGSFLNALILVCFLINDRSSKIKYVFLFFFSIIASFNDRLYIVMLLMPMSAALLLTIKNQNKRYAFISIACIVSGSILGLYSFKWINAHHFINFLSPHKIYAFENISSSFNMFIEQIKNCIINPGFASFQIVFTIFSVIFCSVYGFIKRKTLPTHHLFLILFYILFCIFTWAAPIVNGNYTGYDTLRYNVYPFFFSSVIFAWLLGFIINKIANQLVSQVIPLSMVAAALFFIGLKINVKGVDTYINYYPDTVREIDSVASIYHLKRGISNYWIARKTTMLSKKKISIFSVYEGCNIQELGTNINWYYNAPFDFVVGNKLSQEAILKNFIIKDTIVTNHHTIFTVEKFIYPKGEYFPVLLAKKL